MESITKNLSTAEKHPALVIQPNGFHDKPRKLLAIAAERNDLLSASLRRWSVPALRLALGLVFLWFGILKIAGVSPVTPLLRETYSFFAIPTFTALLGAWEMLIGIGLIFKLALRTTLWFMCAHLIGTFMAFLIAPSIFFVHGNPLVLTTNGEFVMKNLVLLTAGLTVVGHESKRRVQRAHHIRLMNKDSPTNPSADASRPKAAVGQN
jgi:uncharacterized membrane protein YkgB